LATWKRLAVEQAQREVDEGCVAITNKVSKLIPSTGPAAIASVIRAGTIEKRKTQFAAYKKRYLVLAPAGFTDFTKQNGEKKGFCRTADIRSVVRTAVGFDLVVAGTTYMIRCVSDEDAAAWIEAFLSLLGGGKRKQSTVQIAFDDGSRALVEVNEGDV